MDYREILFKLYTPEIGTIWKAPNYIWTTGFAANKPPDEIHPSIIEKLDPSRTIAQLVPGTSKDYMKGSCVFKVKLNEKNRVTNFLLKLAMPYSIEVIKNFERGWNGVLELSEEQLGDFKRQIKFCRG